MLIAPQINLITDLKHLLRTGINAQGTALTAFYLNINSGHRFYSLPMGSIQKINYQNQLTLI
jgi:hypothetical protein